MPKFTPSNMKLIARTAMARFNSFGDQVGYSSLAGVQTNGLPSKGILSPSPLPASEQSNVNRYLARPVSGGRNILPATCYSSCAKPEEKSDGIIKPNPVYFGGQSGARNYATGSLAADLSGAKPWTRPLSPHLPVYKPQSNSTSSIINRITGMYLSAAVLAPYILCMKVGTVSFTYDYVYQLFFYSSKLVPLSAEIAALALGYHVYKGIGHLVADASGSVGKIKRH